MRRGGPPTADRTVANASTTSCCPEWWRPPSCAARTRTPASADRRERGTPSIQRARGDTRG
ncbi:hypothetical protein HBB16_19600 [Pseudonocardia sp. MCCB 268]|nr:hypothetical protein [Pseudonocardia cytotoxica]